MAGGKAGGGAYAAVIAAANGEGEAADRARNKLAAAVAYCTRELALADQRVADAEVNRKELVAAGDAKLSESKKIRDALGADLKEAEAAVAAVEG